MKFLICNRCKNTVALIRDCGVPIHCCGEKMEEISSGKGDGAAEKHIPVYEHKDGKVSVTVGAVQHPMTPEHFIEWICLETDSGVQIKHLTPDSPAAADFYTEKNNKVKAVYAFCNLHSLYKS